MRSHLLLPVLLLSCSFASTEHPLEVSAQAPVPADSTIALRFAPPEGFTRTTAAQGSFAAYLRALPLKPAGTEVHLYNGDRKWSQDVHAAVIDLSVGNNDLQQCADAVMRLRAEHLFAQQAYEKIRFHFTNGFLAEFSRWAKGDRIKVNGNKCEWKLKEGNQGYTHENLMSFLKIVFMYAGSLSLQKELDSSTPADLSASDLQPGDVFIQGGSPGHAMIVVDVAAHADGRKAFLIAQSYMPAQDIHVVKDLRHEELGAWFILEADDRLFTPEWTFEWGDRRRW